MLVKSDLAKSEGGVDQLVHSDTQRTDEKRQGMAKAGHGQ